MQWGLAKQGSGIADKGCDIGRRLKRFDYRAEHLSLSYPAMRTVEDIQLYSIEYAPQKLRHCPNVHKCNVMCSSVTDYRKN